MTLFPRLPCDLFVIHRYSLLVIVSLFSNVLIQIVFQKLNGQTFRQTIASTLTHLGHS